MLVQNSDLAARPFCQLHILLSQFQIGQAVDQNQIRDLAMEEAIQHHQHPIVGNVADDQSQPVNIAAYC